jgi:hypothetical protein
MGGLDLRRQRLPTPDEQVRASRAIMPGVQVHPRGPGGCVMRGLAVGGSDVLPGQRSCHGMVKLPAAALDAGVACVPTSAP